LFNTYYESFFQGGMLVVKVFNDNFLTVREVKNQPKFAGSCKVNNLQTMPLKSVPFTAYNAQNLQAYHLAKPSVISAVAFGRSTPVESVELGCNYKDDQLKFGVYSKNATRIQLEIYDKPIGGKVIAIKVLKKEGDKWGTALTKDALTKTGIDIEAKQPVYYGYRAWGPNWEYNKDWVPGSLAGLNSHVDDKGNRFNPNKLLTDPYAKEISHDPGACEKGSGFLEYYTGGGQNAKTDTGGFGPKSIFVLNDKVDVGHRPTRAFKDDSIYEVHMRGFTMNDKSIPPQLRGTYAGAALKAKYLKDLGITMVEFLPVQEARNDQNDQSKLQDNDKQEYWGYMTLSYFAPERRYAHDKSPGGPTREFKEMVKAFHDQGIKVCMDVVYNHTGEGGRWDKNDDDKISIYSMRGLDNSTYYETCGGGKGLYDNTGCGCNYNIANPAAQRLVIDSLKYWSKELGVDAFRHDLASVLGNTREKDGFYFDAKNKNGYLLTAPKELHARSSEGGEGVDLIAEPWAASGDFVLQTGHFPASWAEWNDTYRDDVRLYLNKQENTAFAKVVSAVSGSSSIFEGQRTRSVNFIVAHDGFTLRDLFSYNSKVNNGPFPSEGGEDNKNYSWDQGGDQYKQRQAVRNAMTVLMLSKGTPIMLGGDEMLRTTLGNNNPYNHDKPFNWLDWNLNDQKRKMLEFTRGIINFRNHHAALRSNMYYEGKDHNNNGVKDITWLMPDGNEADGRYLDNAGNNFLGFRIDGTEFKDKSASIYTAINKCDSPISFKLPKNLPGKKWYVAANTSASLEDKGTNIYREGKELLLDSAEPMIGPRSVMVLIEK
jgi:isoamylase